MLREADLDIYVISGKYANSLAHQIRIYPRLPL